MEIKQVTKPVIGVMSPGDMGHAVAAAIGEKGHRVITVLAGRSGLSKERAARSGMEDRPNLEILAQDADIVLSIMPPEKALAFAEELAPPLKMSKKLLTYVDCNAISPDTTLAVQKIIEDVGATFINAGIIGPPPGRGGVTKFYVSGSAEDQLAFLAGDSIKFIPLGGNITKASAIKMCYAALTKGMMTLYTAALVTGELLGIGEELQTEYAGSQQIHWKAMKKRVPFYAADADRWAGEMDQISETFAAVGMSPNLHIGAADIFRLLEKSPLSAETRETLDKSRTLQQAVDIYTETVRSLSTGKN